VFAYASACAAFIQVRGLTRDSRIPVRLPIAVAFVAMCGLSGWMLDALWANNFDNLLALSSGPALVVALSVPAALDRAGNPMLFGLLIAGTIDVYPELSPMMLGVAFLVAAEAIWRRRPQGWLWRAGLALAVLVLLLAPSSADLIEFFQRQFTVGMRGTVSGA